mgnify:CR=1 FL=1
MGFSSFNNSDVRCGPIPYTGMLYYNRKLEFISATSIKYNVAWSRRPSFQVEHGPSNEIPSNILQLALQYDWSLVSSRSWHFIGLA